MLNYIRSELYRVTHRPGMYVLAALQCTAAVAINAFLLYLSRGDAIQINLTTGYSYSGLISSSVLYLLMGGLITSLIYEGLLKRGVLKNTIANGHSRLEIFAAQCFTSLLVATVILVLTLAAWIASAELLLPSGGLYSVRDVLLQAPALYLIAAANVITMVLLCNLTDRGMIIGLVWLGIWFIGPNLLYVVGSYFDTCAQVASWMPYVFLTTDAVSDATVVAAAEVAGGEATVSVSTASSILWYTADGLRKCLIAGASGVLIFALAGWALLRRRDL